MSTIKKGLHINQMGDCIERDGVMKLFTINYVFRTLKAARGLYFIQKKNILCVAVSHLLVINTHLFSYQLLLRYAMILEYRFQNFKKNVLGQRHWRGYMSL